MKKSDVPQDQSNLEKSNQKEICYAVNDEGDADTCVHTRTGGSPDVFTHGSG